MPLAFRRLGWRAVLTRAAAAPRLGSGRLFRGVHRCWPASPTSDCIRLPGAVPATAYSQLVMNQADSAALRTGFAVRRPVMFSAGTVDGDLWGQADGLH